MEGEGWRSSVGGPQMVLIHSSLGGLQRPISLQVLTKAWPPPSMRCQWSVHCLGDTNTCGNRFAFPASQAVAEGRSKASTDFKGRVERR